MYDRFLFVGLGGAGGSTLGYLKNNIRKWLQENDAGSEIPAGWQFLHIDTPALREDAQEGVDPRLSEDEYLGLIQTYGSEGWGFESLRARQTPSQVRTPDRFDQPTFMGWPAVFRQSNRQPHGLTSPILEGL